jgi:hypothetical protein
MYTKHKKYLSDHPQTQPLPEPPEKPGTYKDEMNGRSCQRRRIYAPFMTGIDSLTSSEKYPYPTPL